MHIHHYLLYTTNTTTCFTPLPIYTTHTTTHFISHATCFTPNTPLPALHKYPFYIIHTTTHFTSHSITQFIAQFTHHYLLYITHTATYFSSCFTPDTNTCFIPHAHTHAHTNPSFCIVCFGLTLVVFVKALQILLYITKTCVHRQKPAHRHTHAYTHQTIENMCISIFICVWA